MHVKGGTNAGRKKPLRAAAGPWPCRCIAHGVDDGGSLAVVWRVNPGYLVRCPECETARP